MSAVLLGVADAVVSPTDQTNWEVSKIGGTPDWGSHGLQTPCCRLCGKFSSLVLQVYCPLEGSPYHRTIYIFACTSKSCWNKSESWSAIRTQLKDPSTAGVPSEADSSVDDSWGVDADDWGDEAGCGAVSTSGGSNAVTVTEWCDEADDWGSDGDESKTDLVFSEKQEVPRLESASVGEKQDSGTEGSFDSDTLSSKLKEMMVEDMDEDNSSSQAGTHCMSEDVLQPQDCALTSLLNLPPPANGNATTDMSTETFTESTSQNGNASLFEARYLSVIEEPSGGEAGDLRHEQKLLAQYTSVEGAVKDLPDGDISRKSKGKSKGGGSEGYEKAVAKHGDQMFQKFLKRLSRCPQQVLRYSHNGSPLYLSQRVEGVVSPCSHCGALRVFELQILPSMVSYLKPANSSECVLEFGTVLVYTCSKSCWEEGQAGPMTELVIHQADPDQHLFKS